LDDGANGCANGDIEQVLIKILFKISWTYIKLMNFYKNIWWRSEVYEEFKEYEKKNQVQNT
jgi:hypothetical protein